MLALRIEATTKGLQEERIAKLGREEGRRRQLKAIVEKEGSHGIVLVIREALVCYGDGTNTDFLRNDDLLVGGSNREQHTDPRRPLKFREKRCQMTRPDESPGSFVDGIDQHKRAATRSLCSRFKGINEFLHGETWKVELLESLGPGFIRADEPLPHKKHCRSVIFDALLGYVAVVCQANQPAKGSLCQVIHPPLCQVIHPG